MIDKAYIYFWALGVEWTNPDILDNYVSIAHSTNVFFTLNSIIF